MSEDLRRLADDLRAASRSTRVVRPVLARGALNIKNDWRDAWRGLAHAPALPYAIGYDLTVGVGGLSAVVGPDKDKPQGALGNIIEFGSATSGPHPGGQAALDREEPRFLSALELALSELL
ncbi:MAG: hypothetical protein ACXVW0_07590 [Nocardioides sp.]